MDKNVFEVFNKAVANGSKLFEAIAEVEKQFNISISKVDKMSLTVQSEPFAEQMSYLNFTDGGNTSLKEGGHSILEPTLCICSEKLLAEIAEALADTAEASEEQKKNAKVAFKKYAYANNTASLLGSIISRGRTLKYDYEKATIKFTEAIKGFCENDLLLAAVILNTKGDVICWNVLKGYTRKPNNKLFGGHNSMYCTAIRTAREHLQAVYATTTTEQATTVAEPVIKEEINMTKKELIKLATKLCGKEVAVATRKHLATSVEDGAQFLYNVLIESEVSTSEFPELAQFVGAEPEVAEEEVPTVAISDTTYPDTTDFELVGKVTTVKTVNVKFIKSAHVSYRAIQQAMSSVILALPEVSSASKTVEIDAKLARQIRQARDEQDGISVVRNELQVLEQRIIDEVAEYVAELNTGKVKAGCGSGGFESRSHHMFARLSSFIDDARDHVNMFYMVKHNEATKESRKKVASLIEKNQTKAAIKVAQIPSRKERIAKKEVVATTVSENPFYTDDEIIKIYGGIGVMPETKATEVVTATPVATTPKKGVPTPKNPKGGNGSGVRLQLRTSGNKVDGYTSVVLMSAKSSKANKVCHKKVTVVNRSLAASQWLALAKALDSLDKDKLGVSKVYIDLPKTLKNFISKDRSLIERSFKWGKAEALAFVDARDSFDVGQIIFRTNGGEGFATDVPFIVPTRKEVGVAPTVGE